MLSQGKENHKPPKHPSLRFRDQGCPGTEGSESGNTCTGLSNL